MNIARRALSSSVGRSLRGLGTSASHSDQSNDNNDVLKDYTNRNPRNLEMLRLGYKPMGYDLEAEPREYYYRVEFSEDMRHTMGCVRHHTGRVVLSASTREWPLQSRLPSTSDYTSAVTVGRVLARRCLEAGITEVELEKFEEAPKSKKLNTFLSELQSGGVTLGEPLRLHPRDFDPRGMVLPTAPWDVPEHTALDENSVNKDETIEPGHRVFFDST